MSGLPEWLLSLALLSCGGDRTCAEIVDSFDRDRCFSEAIDQLPPEQVDAVLQDARSIEDPMIRGAAVSNWVAAHVNEVSRDKGEALCQLLDGRDQSYCQRRLTSPHLQR